MIMAYHMDYNKRSPRRIEDETGCPAADTNEGVPADPFFDFFGSECPRMDLYSPTRKPFWFKEYPRSPKIHLSKPSLPNVSLQDAFLNRITTRTFSQKPIPMASLGSLLYWSAGMIHGMLKNGEDGRRPYPSGGARYPIEIYVSSGNLEHVEDGVFHYNAREHALERMRDGRAKKIQEAQSQDFAKKAPAFILFSLQKERVMEKYGTLGYKLGMLEAGHIGQNVYLAASALNMGTLALGGMDYAAASRELGLGEEEPIFYHIAVGMRE